MPENLTNDKSTLVQLMPWCTQASSHYLNQCWLKSLSPYGITRPRWVKDNKDLHFAATKHLIETYNPDLISSEFRRTLQLNFRWWKKNPCNHKIPRQQIQLGHQWLSFVLLHSPIMSLSLVERKLLFGLVSTHCDTILCPWSWPTLAQAMPYYLGPFY